MTTNEGIQLDFTMEKDALPLYLSYDGYITRKTEYGAGRS